MIIFAASEIKSLKMPEPKVGQDITLRIAFMVNNKPDLRIISVNTPLKSIIQVGRADLLSSVDIMGKSNVLKPKNEGITFMYCHNLG